MNIANIKHLPKVFEVRSDIVVLGTHPENADITNPRGEFYGFSAYLVVTVPDGHRWAHDATCVEHREQDAIRRVEKFKSFVEYAVQNGADLNPAHWREIQPCYGSEAYVREEWEAEAIALERMGD